MATVRRVVTVAVCEDDAALRSVLSRSLAGAGHEVLLAHNGAEALRVFPSAAPDVVILDIGLPDSDGRDVCLALRAGGLDAPVLFLTARDGVHDKVAGFESGADDYLTKPFELPELLVRITALARRTGAAAATADGLQLDPARHAVTAEGTDRPADTDGVPAARQAAGQPRARRAPARAGRRRVADGGGGPRQHARLLHGPAASQARRAPRRATVHRDGPRGRVRVALSLRGRLVAITVSAAVVAVTVLVVGLQLLLAHQSSRESLSTLQGRADAAATTVRFRGGQARVLETPADSLDQNIWIFDAAGRRVDGGVPPRSLRSTVTRLSTADHRAVGRRRRPGADAGATGPPPRVGYDRCHRRRRARPRAVRARGAARPVAQPRARAAGRGRGRGRGLGVPPATPCVRYVGWRTGPTNGASTTSPAGSTWAPPATS